MTNGQLKLLQDLNKCYMPRYWQTWVRQTLWVGAADMGNFTLKEYEKRKLRSLTHQYRNQIKAMKRNQVTP